MREEDLTFLSPTYITRSLNSSLFRAAMSVSFYVVNVLFCGRHVWIVDGRALRPNDEWLSVVRKWEPLKYDATLNHLLGMLLSYSGRLDAGFRDDAALANTTAVQRVGS